MNNLIYIWSYYIAEKSWIEASSKEWGRGDQWEKREHRLLSLPMTSLVSVLWAWGTTFSLLPSALFCLHRHPLLPCGDDPCCLYSITGGGRKGFSSISQYVLGNGLGCVPLEQLLYWHFVHVAWLVWVSLFLSVFITDFFLVVFVFLP